MKHEILYCTQCQVWTLKCSECGMGGCSGGHLNDCSKADEELLLSEYLEKLVCKTNLKELLNQTLN